MLLICHLLVDALLMTAKTSSSSDQVFAAISSPCLTPIIVKRCREDSQMDVTLLLKLIYDPLKPVDHILLILITLKHIKCVEYELILFLDELLENIYVLWVLEMLSCKIVDEVE